MYLSKPGKAVVVSALSLAAAPAHANEPTPLDSAALSSVAALGVDDPALATWLPALGNGPAGTDQHLRTILQSGRSTMSLDRQDGGGTISRIVQTTTIDLPRTAGQQVSMGLSMQFSGYDLAGFGQSATNLVVAATLSGLGGFAPIR